MNKPVVVVYYPCYHGVQRATTINTSLSDNNEPLFRTCTCSGLAGLRGASWYHSCTCPPPSSWGQLPQELFLTVMAETHKVSKDSGSELASDTSPHPIGHTSHKVSPDSRGRKLYYKVSWQKARLPGGMRSLGQ